MAELVDQPAVLEIVRRFRPLWRILLATPGTLQGTLSAYFGTPVNVEVTDQQHRDDVIHRSVNLVTADERIVVCRAATDITLSDPSIRALIEARGIGIGQIIMRQRADSEFRLQAAGQDDACFWRIYTLSGRGFTFSIREEFPKVLYGDG